MYNQTEVFQDLFLSKQRSVRNSENKWSNKNLHRTYLTVAYVQFKSSNWMYDLKQKIILLEKLIISRKRILFFKPDIFKVELYLAL